MHKYFPLSSTIASLMINVPPTCKPTSVKDLVGIKILNHLFHPIVELDQLLVVVGLHELVPPAATFEVSLGHWMAQEYVLVLYLPQ